MLFYYWHQLGLYVALNIMHRWKKGLKKGQRKKNVSSGNSVHELFGYVVQL